MQLPDSGDVFVGRYEIVSVLGEGAFGRVYRAVDRSMQRVVALKVLSPKGEEYSTLSAARFVREAKLLAGLQDPHTLTLYDFGEAADGLLFMATEFIEGTELRQVLQREVRFDEDTTIHVLRQLLSSLREAHSHGLLHRDIKPANVIVHPYEDDRYRVKLLDFGLAKSVDIDATQLTGKGRIAGTPRYMSPEQVLGVKLTPASDLYSLGLVAYEMLVGAPAIDGVDMKELLRAQVQGPPIEVPEPFASPQMRQIVARMTDRNLLARAQDAQSVLTQLDVLRRARAPRPAPTAAPTPRPPTPPERTPHRGIVVLGIVCILFVAATLTAALWPTATPPPPEPRLSEVLRASPEVDSPPVAPTVVVPQRAPDAGPESESEPDGCGKPLEPTLGGHGFTKVAFDGREMTLVVPSSYDPNARHPLVVLLHDAGSTAVTVTKDTQIARAAEKHSFVAIAPRDRSMLTWREDSSLDEVLGALDHVQQHACIDPKRIFVWGHGFGAAMAQLVACERQEIAGLASSYYRMDAIPRCLDRPIPYLSVAGRRDGYAPIEGGVQCLGRDVMSLQEQDTRWREHNRCEEASKSKSKYCTSWTCEAAYESCVFPGGRRFVGQDERNLDLMNCDGPPTTVDVADEVLGFFRDLPSR